MSALSWITAISDRMTAEQARQIQAPIRMSQSLFSKRQRSLLLSSIVGCVTLGCAPAGSTRDSFSTVAEIAASYPHDTEAFTQGLVFHEGRLYEGTGQYGQSTLREVALETGNVLRSSRLSRAYFGEGITIMGNRVFQLTWQNGIGAVYDLESFEVIETFRYEGEGWGLTHDGRLLILSDGSSRLRFIDPESFEVVRIVEVIGPDGPVQRLNELEYIRGEVWANVWYEDFIVRIDPETGTVSGIVDLSALYPATMRSREAVANGIAFDASEERIYVTGKNWPQLYEITLVASER